MCAYGVTSVHPNFMSFPTVDEDVEEEEPHEVEGPHDVEVLGAVVGEIRAIGLSKAPPIIDAGKVEGGRVALCAFALAASRKY